MTNTYPKLLLNGEIEFTEVQYYFLAQINHATQPMAIVSLYSRPDPQVYKDSCWIVYSVTQLPEEHGLQVIECQTIQSVMSVIPHDHHVESGDRHFFVWEKMGLEISLMGVPEPDIELLLCGYLHLSNRSVSGCTEADALNNKQQGQQCSSTTWWNGTRSTDGSEHNAAVHAHTHS